MPDIIKSGDSGYTAKVNKDHRLFVRAKVGMNQHVIAEETQQTYQVFGTATLSSGTVIPLHIQNTNADKSLVITHIRHQVLDQSGGTAFPNASNYFSVGMNRTYSSGGSTATPVNTYASSGNTALATVYQDNPTLAGTVSELDRWYTKAEGDMNVWEKWGSVILPPSGTIEFAYVGDQSSGTVFTRVSFYYEEGDQ